MNSFLKHLWSDGYLSKAIPLAVGALIVVGLLWWRSSGVKKAKDFVDRSLRQSGDSTIVDSSRVTVQERTPVIGGNNKAKSIDSTGNLKNEYRVPTKGSRSDYHETVRVEPSDEATELWIQDPDVTLFPMFRKTDRMTTVLTSDGKKVTVNRKHPSLLSFSVRPVVGVEFSSAPRLQVGTTLLRVGPIFLGGSASSNVFTAGSIEDLNVSFSGDVSTDVLDRLNLSAGYSTRGQVTVGFRYRF